MGWFFLFGLFFLVFCVWGEGLFQTVNMDAMLECVGVSVEGMLAHISVSCAWFFFSN